MTARKLPSRWWLLPGILGGTCIWAAIGIAVWKALA